MSLYFLLLIFLLLQTSTISRSQPMGICKPIDESQPPPILSVFHYPPTKSIVFLLKDNFIQSIPVSAFNLSGASLVGGVGLTYPEKVAANRMLRCCEEPPAVRYQHIQVLPKRCNTETAMFTVRYHVAIKSSGKGGTSSEKDIYGQLSPETAKMEILPSQPHGSPPRFKAYLFCPSGRRCSTVADPVECTGYVFSKDDSPRNKAIDVQDLATATKSGSNAATKFALQSFSANYLKFTREHKRTEDFVRGHLPTGFILDKTVVLFNLLSSEVILLRYTTVPPWGREFEDRLVPVIARSSMAKFFRCPGRRGDNHHNNGGLSSSEKPHSLAFKLSALLILVTLLTVLITVCVVVVRAMRRRRSSHQFLAGKQIVSVRGGGGGGRPETSTVSRKSSYSHIEGGGGGRGGGGGGGRPQGGLKNNSAIGTNRREEVSRSTLNSAASSSSTKEREHGKIMAAAMAADKANSNKITPAGGGGGGVKAGEKKKKKKGTKTR